MPASAFRRLLKTPKNHDSFTGFYMLVGAIFLLSGLNLWDQSQPHPWNWEAQLAFSGQHFKELKLWTLFSHSLLHDNVLDLTISTVSILLLARALARFYSGRELSRFFILSSLAESLSHVLIGPGNQSISGSLGVAMTFLLLYTPLAGPAPLFYLRHFSGHFPVTLPIVTTSLVLLNLFTLGFPWRPDHSSFAGHIGILILVWIALRKSIPDSLYSQALSPQPASAPVFKKNPEEWMAHPATTATATQQKNLSTAPPSLERQVDAILEKISQKGLDSLSDKERGILDKASKMKKKPRS